MGKIVKMTIKQGQKPTEAQIERIRKAAERPVKFDEDSPEYTLEELKEMKQAAIEKRAALKKEVVAIRISPQTLEKAKATGKGYTGFLSRLIDNAIKDKDLVAKSL